MNKIVKRIKRNKFVAISIAIHLIIFLFAFFTDVLKQDYKKKIKYIEITEIDAPSNKVDNNTNRLAKSSNKALKEKVKKDKVKRNEKFSPQIKKSEEMKKKKEEKLLKADEKGDLEKKKKKEKESKASKDSIKKNKKLYSPGVTSPDSEYEETVDFDTKEFKYISYFLKLKRKIGMVWSYPRESYQKGESGKVLLLMSLDRSGKLVNLTMLKSSGFSLLDNEAKNAVLEAAPYPPFPSSWGAMKKINIRISFVYGSEGWWFK